jgi:Ca2+/Na+ antiporter
VVSAGRDFAVLALAVAGLVVVGPMDLFFPLTASIRFGPHVWILMIVLYVLLVVFLILFLRPRLVIYNISTDELRPILADLAGKLDPDTRWAGDSLWLPNLGVQLHVDSVAKMRNVALVSSGPGQNHQGWRRLELALQAALSQVEVPRNFRAVSLVSAALIILLFLVLAVSSDPQDVAQAIVNMFWA